MFCRLVQIAARSFSIGCTYASKCFKLHRMRATLVAIATLLLVVSMVASHGFETTPTLAPNQWAGWAGVAWRYWNNCWNPSTGLTFDSCNWHYFTLWGLASNIIAVVVADEIGLSSDFATRVDKILDFLNSMTLTNGGLPYLIYSSDSRSPATNSPTDGADVGRLSLSLYILKQHLLQLGDTTRASRVDSDFNRLKASSFGYGSDLYGYYASLGYTLWSVRPTNTQSVQSGFQSLVKNGPFAEPSQMYGVSGIPTNTRIDGEPFINAILEAGNLPQIVGLSSWNDFIFLSQRTYSAQERRSALTGKPEFWTGGGLDFSPGFISQWIVWTTGATWVVLNNDGSPFSDSRVPVAYAKLMFAYSAIYGTTYANNMISTYASQLQTDRGFEEGVYANGAFDVNVQIETNQIILSAAIYSGIPQTSTSSSSTSQAVSTSSQLLTSSSLETATQSSGSSSASTSSITTTSGNTSTSSLTNSSSMTQSSNSSSTSISSTTSSSASTSTSTSTIGSSIWVPTSLPPLAGFPWESIVVGVILGIMALGIVRGRKKQTH